MSSVPTVAKPTDAAVSAAATGHDLDDDAARLRFAVMRLHRRLRQLGVEELTLTQGSALASIHRHGPLTLGDLAARENVAPPTITKAVAALEERGFVTRTVDEADRRVARVATTATGHQHLLEVKSRRTAWLAERLERLPSRDRTTLLAALDVLEALGGEEEPL